jgi:hypothetical protein
MSDPFAALEWEQRQQAEDLAETLRALGVDDPERWAASEVTSDTPEVAPFLILRKLWEDARRWTNDPAEWFGPAPETPAPDHPEYPHPPAAQAVHRALAAGVDPRDLMRIARAIVFESFFDVVHVIDEGYEPDGGEGLPGWLLAELAADGTPTGRVVGGLHESLLVMAPPLFPGGSDGPGHG